MPIRGIRGATVVADNDATQIVSETKTLLDRLIKENHLQIEEIASIFFSVTTDLNAEFPAVAARELGLTATPLLCLTEIPVPNSLAKCIRILIQVNSEKAQSEMVHLYLKEAEQLRPDSVKKAAVE